MAIQFNEISTNNRQPWARLEFDNSKAVTGLAENPHVIMIIGQKTSEGTAATNEIKKITQAGLEQGYFGKGSILARMIAAAKALNNQNDIFGMALSDGIGATIASTTIDLSAALLSNLVTGNHTWHLMVAGKYIPVAVADGMSGGAIATATKAVINADTTLPVLASAVSGKVNLKAKNNGTLGNDINVTQNYFDGNENPDCFSIIPIIPLMAGGTIDPDLGDAWDVIAGEQYHGIIQPYTDTSNLTSLTNELARRWNANIALDVLSYTSARATLGEATALGNSLNNPYLTFMPAQDSPSGPEIWAAEYGALDVRYLNQDPARPLHGIALNVLPPKTENRWTGEERNGLLYDGVSTYTVSKDGTVRIERAITTYQVNSVDLPDISYLDLMTPATNMELRYQWVLRMGTLFIAPRKKLANDGTPPIDGVVTPQDIKSATIALFSELQLTKGLIEDMEAFKQTIIAERSGSNRVDVLFQPNLINQLMQIAGKAQFIL